MTDDKHFVFKHDVETVLESNCFIILKLTKATYNFINKRLNELDDREGQDKALTKLMIEILDKEEEN